MSSVASSPSKRTKRISGAPRGRSMRRSARAISSTAAVPPAPSLAPTKPGQVLGVVVRGDDDRRLAARDPPDDVAQARVAGHVLEAPAREPLADVAGELAQLRRAGRARAELDLVAQDARTRARSRSGRRAARRARRPRLPARGRGPVAAAARAASTSATTTTAGRAIIATTRPGLVVGRHRLEQVGEALSRGLPRRVGTCSLGTPSAGGS